MPDSEDVAEPVTGGERFRFGMTGLWNGKTEDIVGCQEEI